MIRLCLAALLAGVIGIERELREQEAGLRTHMLVCVGATMFMIVGVYGWSDFQLGNNIGVVVDPSRVASYVVSGIGFLGAGAIIRHGINVRGLTTAASLWVVAAIGVAVGVGHVRVRARDDRARYPGALAARAGEGRARGQAGPTRSASRSSSRPARVSSPRSPRSRRAATRRSNRSRSARRRTRAGSTS